MRRKGSQSFLEGAALLAVSTVVVKVIGACFKIPLANILGGVGMSYFSSAYDLFVPVYSVAVTGLGVAASRLTSQDPSGGEEVLRASRRLFLPLGVLGTAAVLLLAPAFSRAIGNPGAAPAVASIAPAVFFSCVSAVYRGYFQGRSDMAPTAGSQVAEALVRLAAGTGLAWGSTLVLRRGFLETGEVLGRAFASEEEAALAILPVSAAAAIWGVTLSTLAGALYIRRRWAREGRHAPSAGGGKGASRKAAELLRIAVPISLSALVVNLASVIDLASVMNCLAAAVENGGETVRGMYPGLIPGELPDGMLPEYLYGSYSGLVFSLFNLAPALTAALGVSALPAAARAWSSGDRRELEYTAGAALRMAFLLGAPAGLGLFALAEPILAFLYPARLQEAAMIAPVLRLMGLGSILAAVSAPAGSLLQAVGREKAALAATAGGAAVKLLVNWTLVSRPEVNIRGVAWGALACYGFVAAFSIIFLRLSTGIRLRLLHGAGKPIFCGILCAGAAYCAYHSLFSGVPAAFRLFLSIGCGGTVYLVSALFTGAFEARDLELLPNHEKVEKALAKRGLIR